jgi:hypothetical protein
MFGKCFFEGPQGHHLILPLVGVRYGYDHDLMIVIGVSVRVLDLHALKRSRRETLSYTVPI